MKLEPKNLCDTCRYDCGEVFKKPVGTCDWWQEKDFKYNFLEPIMPWLIVAALIAAMVICAVVGFQVWQTLHPEAPAWMFFFN